MKYKYGGTKNKVGPKFGKNQVFILKCSEGWGHQGNKGNIPQKKFFFIASLSLPLQGKAVEQPGHDFPHSNLLAGPPSSCV